MILNFINVSVIYGGKNSVFLHNNTLGKQSWLQSLSVKNQISPYVLSKVGQWVLLVTYST